MSNENKQKLKEYQKNIVKLIKKMHDQIHNEHFADLFSYLSMHCLSSVI